MSSSADQNRYIHFPGFSKKRLLASPRYDLVTMDQTYSSALDFYHLLDWKGNLFVLKIPLDDGGVLWEMPNPVVCVLGANVSGGEDVGELGGGDDIFDFLWEVCDSGWDVEVSYD